MKQIIAPLIALICLTLSAACRSQPATVDATAPPPSPTATVATSTNPPAATTSSVPIDPPADLPTEDITLALGPAVTTTITASSGFTATLPPRWQPVAFGDEALVEVLAADERLSADDLRGMIEMEGEQTEFVALLLDEITLAEASDDLARMPSLHVLRLPATGLLLNNYAQGTASMVQALGGRVQSNQLRDDLRPEEELSSTLIFERGGRRVAQIIFLDAPPSGARDDLIVLTFVAPGERFGALLPIVEQIAASVGLEE